MSHSEDKYLPPVVVRAIDNISRVKWSTHVISICELQDQVDLLLKHTTMQVYKQREQQSAAAFSRSMFAWTQKAIDFINDNHERFCLLYDGKPIRFDKIVPVVSNYGIDVVVYINSTRWVSIDWSLKDIVVRV